MLSGENILVKVLGDFKKGDFGLRTENDHSLKLDRDEP